MSLCYHANEIIIASPLLKFYLSIGMKASNVQWATQYSRAQPFKPFVEELVEVRINAVGKNKPLGDR